MGEIISHGWAGRGGAWRGEARHGKAWQGNYESHGREQWQTLILQPGDYTGHVRENNLHQLAARGMVGTAFYPLARTSSCPGLKLVSLKLVKVFPRRV